MQFRPVVQEEMSFKDISYLELWRPFRSVEWNRLWNLGRGSYKKNSVNSFRSWDSGSGRDVV